MLTNAYRRLLLHHHVRVHRSFGLGLQLTHWKLLPNQRCVQAPKTSQPIVFSFHSKIPRARVNISYDTEKAMSGTEMM